MAPRHRGGSPPLRSPHPCGGGRWAAPKDCREDVSSWQVERPTMIYVLHPTDGNVQMRLGLHAGPAEGINGASLRRSRPTIGRASRPTPTRSRATSTSGSTRSSRPIARWAQRGAAAAPMMRTCRPAGMRRRRRSKPYNVYHDGGARTWRPWYEDYMTGQIHARWLRLLRPDARTLALGLPSRADHGHRRRRTDPRAVDAGSFVRRPHWSRLPGYTNGKVTGTRRGTAAARRGRVGSRSAGRRAARTARTSAHAWSAHGPSPCNPDRDTGRAPFEGDCHVGVDDADRHACASGGRLAATQPWMPRRNASGSLSRSIMLPVDD